jgi:hypothetical protein
MYSWRTRRPSLASCATLRASSVSDDNGTRAPQSSHDDAVLERWLAALEQRHLANLAAREVARALRALSSLYVERRTKLAGGAALDTAGKRAAFAMFYAPVHLLITREILRALPSTSGITDVIDLGCGTGAAGAAWALDAGSARIWGFDRHPWAVSEATWTYRQLRLTGRAVHLDVTRAPLHRGTGAAIVAAYVANELTEPVRSELLARLLVAHGRGARVLIIEPIAKVIAPWWPGWRQAVEQRGGRHDEWRLTVELPARQRQLARAAGLDPRELTARTLFLA